MTPTRTVSANLHGDLRRRVNHLAHAIAMRHEIKLRARFTDELCRLVNSGSNSAELHRYLDEIEKSE